jgi:hypothetical protein
MHANLYNLNVFINTHTYMHIYNSPKCDVNHKVEYLNRTPNIMSISDSQNRD